MERVEQPELDLRERGAPRDGVPQVTEERLFMELIGLECAPGRRPRDVFTDLVGALASSGLSSVVYEDVSHPAGFGVLSFTLSPEDFVTRLRPALEPVLAAGTRVRPELAMCGRTYSSGFEHDLEYWLLRRPRETLMNPAWPWAVWYPLRRSGAFERLSPKEKGAILHEHAAIGKAYGNADLAHDVRLACHGLDTYDNEFVIGLIGKELFPLSHVVQAMRKTRQTSEYIAQMGPFFVGHVAWRSEA